MEQLALPGVKTYPGLYECRVCGRKKKADKYRFDKKHGSYIVISNRKVL